MESCERHCDPANILVRLDLKVVETASIILLYTNAEKRK